MALTAKQNIFVANYIKEKNATKAAKAAGYSEKTANEQGARLLANVSIKAEIDKMIEAQRNRCLVDADYVINGIRKIADHGEKEADKLKAYELLGKHLKLFTDKIEQTGDTTIKVSLDIDNP